jgi:hypothetical protein
MLTQDEAKAVTAVQDRMLKEAAFHRAERRPYSAYVLEEAAIALMHAMKPHMPKITAHIVSTLTADGLPISERFTLKGEAELKIANLLEDGVERFTYRKVTE